MSATHPCYFCICGHTVQHNRHEPVPRPHRLHLNAVLASQHNCGSLQALCACLPGATAWSTAWCPSAPALQVRFWQKLLAQVHEYLGKKSLDTLLCLSAHAEVIKPPTKPRGQQPAGSTGGSSAPGGAASTRLRVVLTGDRRKNPPGLTHVAPIHVVNDINLLTLMDSVKLLTETL